MSGLLDKTRGIIRKTYPSFEYTVFNDAPVTTLTKPLSACRMALLSTGGLHLKSEVPFDTGVPEGDCSYRMLPADVVHDDIMVTHESYDHKFINADLNCVFPIDRMRKYVQEGRLGSLSEEHYSFMGHIYETGPLLENARRAGERLRSIGVDVASLLPRELSATSRSG